ncbi:hypothetical protein [Mesorhizobium sp.]|uniref:hypothetical protein n=1 Tax=Mesorhizobium sp. TaxID=1871066 RepID=UPI0025FDF8CE|nr:hypothetical protein [Mesorhizobium sp.]
MAAIAVQSAEARSTGIATSGNEVATANVHDMMTINAARALFAAVQDQRAKIDFLSRATPIETAVVRTVSIWPSCPERRRQGSAAYAAEFSRKQKISSVSARQDAFT